VKKRIVLFIVLVISIFGLILLNHFTKVYEAKLSSLKECIAEKDCKVACAPMEVSQNILSKNFYSYGFFYEEMNASNYETTGSFYEVLVNKHRYVLDQCFEVYKPESFTNVILDLSLIGFNPEYRYHINLSSPFFDAAKEEFQYFTKIENRALHIRRNINSKKDFHVRCYSSKPEKGLTYDKGLELYYLDLDNNVSLHSNALNLYAYSNGMILNVMNCFAADKNSTIDIEFSDLKYPFEELNNSKLYDTLIEPSTFKNVLFKGFSE